jgi:predicted SAM-dependent methyltransferase
MWSQQGTMNVRGDRLNHGDVIPETPSDAERRLTDYLAEVRAEDPGPPQRRLLRSLVPESLRHTSKILLTDAIGYSQRRKAHHLAQDAPLRLHLGSGRSPKPGWVNIDLVGYPADLYWNLLRPLPFASSSVDAVFHEHVLEHFSLQDALEIVRGSFRVLRPEGILRIGVPDLGRYIQAYAGDDSLFEEVRPNRPTRALAMQELFFRHGHRSAWDWDTLALIAQAAGFRTCERRLFGESQLDPVPDSEERRPETLYVECRK